MSQNCVTGQYQQDECMTAVPGVTYRGHPSRAHIDPNAYNANYLSPPYSANYLVMPRAYDLGIISPYVNDIRTQSGFECCTTLANDCKCSPKEYTPGYRLPGVFSDYESSCPCYPITLPGPDYGKRNDVPWKVPFWTDDGVQYVINPSLTNIQPP